MVGEVLIEHHGRPAKGMLAGLAISTASVLSQTKPLVIITRQSLGEFSP